MTLAIQGEEDFESEVVLCNDAWSHDEYSVSCMAIHFSVLADHQIKHQATLKFMGSQHDYIWPC